LVSGNKGLLPPVRCCEDYISSLTREDPKTSSGRLTGDFKMQVREASCSGLLCSWYICIASSWTCSSAKAGILLCLSAWHGVGVLGFLSPIWQGA